MLCVTTISFAIDLQAFANIPLCLLYQLRIERRIALFDGFGKEIWHFCCGNVCLYTKKQLILPSHR